jgi:hypothetical protein
MDSYDTPVDEVLQPSEEELSHSDKMIGVFTEPDNTFSKISKFPPKTIDWLLPMTILLLVVALTQILVMTNEEIYFQVKEKQRAETEKMFNDMVEKGQITREQADQQMEMVEERMDMGRGPGGMALMVISIFFIGFLMYFIVSGVYFLLSRFALKGTGTYKSSLVANGLTSYIAVISIILAAILSYAFGRQMMDISVASLINADKTTFAGFALSKLDIFSIWVYIVLSIGLARMFKSESKGKYYIMVFGLWIIWSFITFFIAKAVPFLSFLNR